LSAPTLVVLAAGVGSRFGGPKQLSPVGPSGETLLDYSVHDARRAGFGKIVVVTRPELAAAFERLDVTIAIQRLDDVPAGTVVPGRAKPWGTGQAVLAVATEVDGPFVVANADDFYGRDAFATAAQFLSTSHSGPPDAFANVAYPLRDTLSDAGGVNRAVCHADGDGWLETVDEVVDIQHLSDGGYGGTDSRGRPVRLAPDSLVSMNLWVFTPAVFPLLRRGFTAFLHGPSVERGEFLIPHAIRDAMQGGGTRVRLLRTKSRWLGVTYAADRPRVEAALRQLVAAGEYPERLWR
jgi:hypothetical protein